MKIDILLATYNGGKFIEQQILTIIAQSYKNWELLIHDDGSTDNTLEIINYYSNIDKRIRLIDDGIKGLGAPYNFLHLFNYSQADFIMLCDQDDIWLENKVSDSYQCIAKRNNKIPQVVYSNSFIYHSENCCIQGKATLFFPEDLKDLLFLNSGIQGCAMIMNSKVRDYCLNMPDYITMHDHLLSLIAVTFGEFTYLDKRLMLYRQHSHTVTPTTPNNIFQRIKLFISRKKPIIHKKHYNAVNSFFRKYESYITKENKEILMNYLAFPHYNRLQRMYHVVIKGYGGKSYQHILLIKILLRKII